MHTVEVAVLDEQGNGNLYLRDLEIEQQRLVLRRHGGSDRSTATTPAARPICCKARTAPYDFDSSLDGRLAFYVTGKFNEDWRLTASADTREGRCRDLFSNFLDKSPDALFRRIDPDYHYPTFGDDGTVEEMAPTQGKMYVKAEPRRELWRCGATSRSATWTTSSRRSTAGSTAASALSVADGDELRRAAARARRFAAEPGTIASREEFRGTGGSLYFLRHQDILTGSERVRIEVRDKESGLVTGVVNLRRPSTTTSTICRAASCSRSPALDRRRRTAGAQRRADAATRRISSCATNTRRASRTSMRWRPAAKATIGSTTTSRSA